ncbi:MAG TPA: O-antigen ligase family protein [Solirubrobacterales bacterium]
MSDFLAGAGLLIAAAAAVVAILLPPGRARSAAMLVALVLFPALILGDQWHTRAIADLRHDSGRLLGLAALGLLASAGLAASFRRWPILLPLAIVAALPFRIPLHAGGDTANLLVPLYLVIAGGVLATAWASWVSRRAAAPGPAGQAARSAPPRSPSGPAARFPIVWLPRALAAVVALYAVQTLYSSDFSKGLQDVCFFFVPFSLVYALLRDVTWDRRLLALILWVVGVEAVAFVLVGSVEYLTRELFWNDQVIRSNEFHTYFRVNSVFWDPNVYGRYLALAIVIAMAALMWARERRTLALLAGLVAVLWLGLAPTFSQSSFIALLAGLAVLAALRWSMKWTLASVALGAVAAVLVVTLVGGSSKINFSRINIDTSGRANLVSGGLHLFAQRPVQGYGSGSFQRAYNEHVDTGEVPVSVSHTEPVTVAAEQGILGLAAYLALLTTALWTMSSGLLRARPAGPVTGEGGPAVDPRSLLDPPPPAPPAGEIAARAAVLAAFTALLVHTMAYAGFYEDPIAWVLLAAGVSLAPAVRDPA